MSEVANGRFVVGRRWPALAGAAALTLGATAVLAVSTAAPAAAVDRTTAVHNATAYAKAHGYRVGVAVYDTVENKLYAGGYARSTFASESVVKAMIATRLLLQGRMHGTTASRAYKMITQSDDAIASSFYGSVGGDSLITWIKRHYHVSNLGSPPRRSGWWGNTHITAVGLVEWYAKVKKDRRVWPWLSNAMHHAHRYGSDGTYQYFGLPSATSGAAIKQGWGTDYDDWSRSADFNSTGFVNGNRYAVAILARGPARTYGSAIGSLLTHTAKLLLPGGRFPDGPPTITHKNHVTGYTVGGQSVVLHGRDFTHVSKVTFGGVAGRNLRVVSSTTIYVTSPPHKAGAAGIQVWTDHGVSVASKAPYTYYAPPTISSVSPSSGSPTGGNRVTLHGTDFRYVTDVRFGSRSGTSIQTISPTTLTVVVPAGAAGSVPVRVHTYYGWSSLTGARQYTYLAPAPATGSTPSPSPSGGSSTHSG